MLDTLSNLSQRVMPRPNATGAGPAAIGQPAAKHFDPVVGVDLHLEIVPPVAPIPNPFIGFLFDPFDYIPFIGATVYVNGVPRAQAGTAGIRMPPHKPIVGPFAKPPGDECEMLMGSMTVAVDSDAFSYMALPALSCNDPGIPPIPRIKSPPINTVVLPTSIVIAIPMGPPVFVGGPPTISLMGLGMRAGVALLGKAIKKSGLVKKLGSAAKESKPGKLVEQGHGVANKKLADVGQKCGPVTKRVKWLARKTDGILNDPFFPRKNKGLTDEPSGKTSCVNRGCGQVGEPVDVVSGANVDEFQDFELPGVPPLVWTRYYDSRWAARVSPAGRGVRFGLQRQLWRHERGFSVLDGEGEPVDLPPLPHDDDVVSRDGYRLRKVRGGIEGTSDGEIYEVHRGGEVMRFSPLYGDAPSPMEQLRIGGCTWVLHYDEHGGLVRLEDDQSRSLSLVYDPWGHVTAVADGHDPTEPAILARYRYDDRGCLVEYHDAYGRSSTYAYDDAGRMTRKTDGNGCSFHYRYDEAGRCVHSWGDDGVYDIHLAYDPEGGETTVVWPDGGVWRYRYDERGALTEIVDPDGWSRRFVSDDQGRIVRQLDEAGNATTLLYDDVGRHTGRRDPLGYLAPQIDELPELPDSLGYELPQAPSAWRWGNRVRLCRDGVPRLGYERLGRVCMAHDEYGAERWQHDATGNVVGYRDRDGRITRLRYGAWNHLREIVDEEGGVTTLDSDFRGKVTRIEDPGGARHEYHYDRKGRLVEVGRDGASMERYRWDRSDNLVEKLDGRGRTLLSLVVGSSNLMKERRLASGEVQRFEHDGRGRIVRASTATLVIERDYDERGRVVRDVRDTEGVEHELVGGQLVASRWFGRFEARYEPDVGGVLVVVDPTGGRHRLEAGEDGTITRRLTNGTVERTWYDRRGTCTRIEVRAPTQPPWVREYRSSGHGDLLEVRDSTQGVSTYRYDGMHRLVEASDGTGRRERYRWDLAGNLLGQPGLHDVDVGPGNRLRMASGERLDYDDRLRLCRRERPDDTTEYRYDSLDRLVAAVRSGERWSASYDPLGRRVSKTWRGRTTVYHWDDFRLAAERLPDGTQRLFVYADLEALVPMMFVDLPSVHADPSAGRVFFILTDQIGAPLCVQDACGQVVWRAMMRPFGAVDIEPTSTVALDLRFPGHLHDPELGLHYNRFRYYDPLLGRYLQPDPLGVAGGLNVYQYCPRPLSAVDLDGLACTGNGLPPPSRSWVGTIVQSVASWLSDRIVAGWMGIRRWWRGRSPIDDMLESPLDALRGQEFTAVYMRPRDEVLVDTMEVDVDLVYKPDWPHFQVTRRLDEKRRWMIAEEEEQEVIVSGREALYTPMRPQDVEGEDRLSETHKFDIADSPSLWVTEKQTGCTVVAIDWGDGQYSMVHVSPHTTEYLEKLGYERGQIEESRAEIQDELLREDVDEIIRRCGNPPPQRYIMVQSGETNANEKVINVFGTSDGIEWTFYKQESADPAERLSWQAWEGSVCSTSSTSTHMS